MNVNILCQPTFSRSFIPGKKHALVKISSNLKGRRVRTSTDQVHDLCGLRLSAGLSSSQVTQVFDFLSKKKVPHGLYPIRINPDTGHFSGTKVCKEHPNSIRWLSRTLHISQVLHGILYVQK